MRNLGRAFSILAEAQAHETHLHHDVAAFGGCGDCHASISRGEARRQREARRHARAAPA